MNKIQAYPLQWPLGYKRTKHPENSRFGLHSIAEAKIKLFNELHKLQASNIVLSSNLRLKKDGTPYSVQKKPDDTGIAVYFSLKGEQKVLACDAWDRCACNIWAIAKGIDAMRGIERWKISEVMNQMFTGFKAIPEKTGGGANVFENCTSKEEIKLIFKEMVLKYHPDTGRYPDVEKFNQIIKQRNIAVNTI